MAELRPFRALRPPTHLAPRIASPPYDVVSLEEGRALTEGNPHSFLHVTRPELQAPASTDAKALPQLARNALDAFVRQGWLVPDPREGFYVYRLEQAGHSQTGVVALASVEAYDAGNIRRHELTRSDKEEERSQHFEAVGGNDEPVFLIYRARAEIDGRVAQICAGPAELRFTADDGVTHTLWRVRGEDNSSLSDAFRRVHLLYIADGHHRSAAASRVRNRVRAGGKDAADERPEDWFLSVVFPHDQVQVLPYHRLVRDLDGTTPSALLERLEQDFEVEPEPEAPKLCEHQFGLFVENRWWRLSAHGGTSLDPASGTLDVALLQQNVLNPLLGIRDPRDKRLAFIGGNVALESLAEKVRSGEFAAAFALYPTPLASVLSLADAGEILPSKSTWFAPKLRSGLFVYRYR